MNAKVVVALPLYGHVPNMVAVNLAGMTQHMSQSQILSGFVYSTGALVDHARNFCVAHAMDHSSDPTHIFWMDGDMVIPHQAVERLLSLDVDIASGLYHQKTEPFKPVVLTLDDEGETLNEDIDIDAPQIVDGVGMGCLLVRLDVYRNMSEHYGDLAWYRIGYPRQFGEDIWFFRRCKEMGIPVWLDPRVRAGHIRDQIITTEDWLRERTNTRETER